jgi:hypothetical protein
MFRTMLVTVLFLATLALPLWADEKKEAEEAIPPVASDAQAKEALATFKKDFRARGLKGDEKLGEQDFALRTLAKVQHRSVVDALAKVTKNRSIDLRTSAVLRLGEQRALPGYAGAAVVKAMDRNSKDPTFLMAGLEAIGRLQYLGATEVLRDMMKHPDYAVRKNALVTIGEIKDHRFIEEIVKLMKQLKLEKGAKWDGVEVHYDSGASGDEDQRTAERMGHAAEAKNKGKGKRSARNQRDIGPIVLELMYELTGQRVSGGVEARKWLAANKEAVDKLCKADEAKATHQVDAAKGS